MRGAKAPLFFMESEMTLAEFRVIYPEFEKVPDAVVQRYLDEFLILYPMDYGTYQDTLQGLYVAHYLSIGFNLKTGGSKGGSQTFAVTSRSVGDVSMSGSLIGVDATSPWDASLYGQKFKLIIMAFGAGPMLTGRSYGYGYGQ